MANSPSHKFGQDLGNLLEHVVLYLILKPRLESFAKAKNYYLDWQKDRPARTGKKVTWADKYGNTHDLDFVIEVGGTEESRGTPVAFIEAAWRRYTKHSKNKAQEIQAAILPIIEVHHLSAPFFGAVLAGEFTKPALEQLRRHRFSVLYIPYDDVVDAFKAIDFDIAFNEGTSDAAFAEANQRLFSLTDADKTTLRNALITASKPQTDAFMTALQKSLERLITRIILLPLFGTEVICGNVQDAIEKLAKLDKIKASGTLHKIEVIVDYDNEDSIRASFKDDDGAQEFLRRIAP
ncbi:hypothetical protein DR64_3393 [Paraburkholderia xenovorans LB400]|uniref:DNA methylase n=1 Tax=Paraburkholderia xenovorans (strain LB400) TaxID=266265 RepID=Q13W20_PARXL|nr:hypothetical protein [Paraburkholderia xenovorans]ABE31719.1 hypothetical protein Bxe_A1234 [Paraburkholderia xenovorans LB400]AIP31619.1 hypothetical protein DR64_3393 [Paraburkholderia xenovorans LB400]